MLIEVYEMVILLYFLQLLPVATKMISGMFLRGRLVTEIIEKRAI